MGKVFKFEKRLSTLLQAEQVRKRLDDDRVRRENTPLPIKEGGFTSQGASDPTVWWGNIQSGLPARNPLDSWYNLHSGLHLPTEWDNLLRGLQRQADRSIQPQAKAPELPKARDRINSKLVILGLHFALLVINLLTFFSY